MEIQEHLEVPSGSITDVEIMNNTPEKSPQHSESRATSSQPTNPKPSADIPPPPDGGLRAWLQVLAGHLIIFNCWGYVISFGIFQPHYEQTLSLPSSTISWIGSTQTFLLFLVGTFSGRAFDAGYYRLTLLAGQLLQVIAIFTASAALTNSSSSYWHLFLAQGVCQGIGCGLVFAPTIAHLSTYFAKKKVLALSTAACGGATGGVVFPLMAQQLLPKIGFGWTVRAMGLVALTAAAINLALVRTRLPPRRSGPLVDWHAFREPTYVLYAISMFFTLWSTYCVYSYARSYAVFELAASQSASFDILMAISVIGIPGRLIPAILADRLFGPVNVFVFIIFGASVCLFSWAAVTSMPGLFAWVVVFGFFGAAIQSLFPATLATLTRDLSRMGTRVGMIFTIVSVPALTGAPLAGKLVQDAGGSYIGMQVWGGSSMMLGMMFLLAARWANNREKQT